MPFPPTFTNNWDITFPPDTQLANLLGQDLRNVRVDVMQRMSLLSGLFANRPTPETVNATWGGAGFGLIYISTDTNQIFQWNGASWTDITSSVGGSGNVKSVGPFDLTAQAGNFATQTFTTPAANGFYQTELYLIITQAATTSSLTPTVKINYTDADTGLAQSLTIFVGSNANVVGGGLTVGGGTNIYAKSGVAITMSSSGYASSGATPMQYAVHGRLIGPM